MYQVFRPYITEDEINAVTEVMKSRWIGLGPKCAEFEDMFAKYTGAKHCVTFNSCTASLDVALRLCGISQHDKVLVPTMTFISTAHTVCYNNATPVFVDCDDQMQMDYEDMLSKIDNFVKAIIIVHYGGKINTHIKEIAELCKKRNIFLIEDCAHASGSFMFIEDSINKLNDSPIKLKHAGTFGDIGCFSFHAVKNLAMGDGGAFITNNSDWAERAKKLRWLGIDKDTWDRTSDNKEYWWEYQVNEIGYKNHLNDISAAIGIEQLKKLDKLNGKRNFLTSLYRIQLSGLVDEGFLTLPLPDSDFDINSCHLMWIRAKQRDDLSLFLKENDINTGVHYRPIHTYKCYGNKPHLPQSELYFKELLSLPMYVELEEKDVIIICDKIKEFYATM